MVGIMKSCISRVLITTSILSFISNSASALEYIDAKEWDGTQCVGWVQMNTANFPVGYGNASNYTKNFKKGVKGWSFFDKTNYAKIKKGDVLLWNETWNQSLGHMAVVSSVSGSTVTISQRNWIVNNTNKKCSKFKKCDWISMSYNVNGSENAEKAIAGFARKTN